MAHRPTTSGHKITAGLLFGAMLALVLMANSVHAAPNFTFNGGRLPEAVKMLQSMCAVNVETRVLLIQSERWSHKVVTFVYPTGSTHLWIWDPESKSRELRAKADEPMAIAIAWGREMVPGERIIGATFETGDNANQCLHPG